MAANMVRLALEASPADGRRRPKSTATTAPACVRALRKMREVAAAGTKIVLRTAVPRDRFRAGQGDPEGPFCTKNTADAIQSALVGSRQFNQVV